MTLPEIAFLYRWAKNGESLRQRSFCRVGFVTRKKKQRKGLGIWFGQATVCAEMFDLVQSRPRPQNQPRWLRR